MKQTLLRQHTRLAAGSVLLLITIVIACRKQDKPTIIDNSFSVAAAKEWYYSTFKKSKEWAKYYEYTTPKSDRKQAGKKLPDWRNGVYYKIGGMEIMELPLVKMQTSFPLPADAGLTTAQLKKIAAASLSRIVFIKKSNGEIIVREIDYIPAWSYLEQKGFDISNVTLLNDKAAFWGRVIIKDWNGRQMAKWVVKNGKLKKGGLEMRLSNGAEVAGSTTEDCGILVTEYERDCYPVYEGDLLVESNCTPWEPTGNQWFEPVSCEEPNPCEGLTDEECACQVFNACNDGGGDEDGNDCDPNAVYPENQEFDNYVSNTSSPADFQGTLSDGGDNPIHGGFTWDVMTGLIANWKVQANTNYTYYHQRFFNSQTLSYQDEFDLTLFNTGNGFYTGSHSFITSEYTTTTPTVNQIINNNSATTRGWSRVMGKIRHKANIQIRLPFCNPLTLDQEDLVDNSLTFTPR